MSVFKLRLILDKYLIQQNTTERIILPLVDRSHSLSKYLFILVPYPIPLILSQLVESKSSGR